MSIKENKVSLLEKVSKRQWYHKIDLGHGLVTPGFDFDPLWDMVRNLKRKIDYNGKRVVDIGSWDGMWAFEAEQHGASLVVATDIYPYAYTNFLLCRDILQSQVQPFFNTSVYNLRENLAPILYELRADQPVETSFFDIVQNFGVMYHVRDPMFGFASCRSVLKTGGILIMETAAVLDETDSFMLLNGYPPEPRIYNDPTTWWAVTIPCLKEMLEASLFSPRMDQIEVLEQHTIKGRKIGRLGIIADAIGPEDNQLLPKVAINEYLQPFRSPGASLDHLRGR